MDPADKTRARVPRQGVRLVQRVCVPVFVVVVVCLSSRGRVRRVSQQTRGFNEPGAECFF